MHTSNQADSTDVTGHAHAKSPLQCQDWQLNSTCGTLFNLVITGQICTLLHIMGIVHHSTVECLPLQCLPLSLLAVLRSGI